MNDFLKKRCQILILGDLILDVYYKGNAGRISPEAPVPIVTVEDVAMKLGGAANVANNVSKLNSSPVVIGLLGEDDNGLHLKHLLDANHIENYLLKTDDSTITKIRVVAGIQQLVRVDFEKKLFVSSFLEKQVTDTIKQNIEGKDIIILSDYGKGFATTPICRLLIESCRKKKKILIVDPKGTDWEKYRGATIVTPNLKELSVIAGKEIVNEDTVIEEIGRHMINKYDLDYLLVTRSEKGMTFLDQNKAYHIRTEAAEVYDVSGAGDTVVAVLAVALASSMPFKEAVSIANKAAGIVVGKVGTVPITYGELQSSIGRLNSLHKIYTEDNCDDIIEYLRTMRKTIVFTNGCFDLLHKGHVLYLQEAKTKGDILVVGLNSDASVRALKGNSRPIKNEEERSVILSSLKVVDFVITFNSSTPYNLIRKIKPDVLVKGGDYRIKEVVGREFAKETVIIPYAEGYSTTSTINQIMK
jgi:D-beta-D-heptose 7-phosphate kinase/D-beta-D-heptose 1-phosphate adenosyltransferase